MYGHAQSVLVYDVGRVARAREVCLRSKAWLALICWERVACGDWLEATSEACAFGDLDEDVHLPKFAAAAIACTRDRRCVAAGHMLVSQI